MYLLCTILTDDPNKNISISKFQKFENSKTQQEGGGGWAFIWHQ